ncbi:MAG: FAD-dependent oxidoreductase [Chloroflexota bacterium]
MKEIQTDILIIGGGLGGVAAALAALHLGKKVTLTEETDWLGGQLTSQGVPPDEHPWIEATGCTASYRQLRERIRAYYRHNYPLTPEARNTAHLNPGQGFVSALCHEPRVALAVIDEMLAPYRARGLLTTLLNHRPIGADTNGDIVQSVTLMDTLSGEQRIVTAPYILDATELGDLLELAGVEHVIGAESQDETGEPHALAGEANPLDQQAVSWCFALDYFPDEYHTIEKPENYDFWRTYQPDFWPNPLFDWTDVNPITLEPRYLPIFIGPTDEKRLYDFWHYRRILYRKHFESGYFPSDICLINWPQIDYWLGPLVGVSDEEKNKHLTGAREQSLAFLYWMQTEAPNLTGGQGYPGLRLRPEVMGTHDGLAKSVYIRESRRIQAEFTVTENHVGVEARGDLIGADIFSDSVGVGSYRIDLHPSTGLRTYVDVSSWPFQIPLGALIPIRVKNLLPACKNLGVTHITNGCYRLHPVEWNIGEAAGALAAYCLEKSVSPRQVYQTESYLSDFQATLENVLGFVLTWPEYVRRVAR